MIGTYHIDDLDGAVTLFKSTDEGTETIAVFDEEHREVIHDLLAEVKRLREDIISILGAIDLPVYDKFPLTQRDLRNMMTKYGQEHLIREESE